MKKLIAIAAVGLLSLNSLLAGDMTTCTMKDGKMMCMMDKDMTMENGTKVMTDGKVMMKDGKEMMLKDGDSVMPDGTVKMAGDKMEKGKMKDSAE